MAAAHRVRVVLEYLDVQPGERILDCGCGLGWMTHVVRELHDCRLAATDYDVARLTTTRREVASDVSVAASDVLRLPYADDGFDKVILSEVLEHIVDDSAALFEVARVVKPRWDRGDHGPATTTIRGCGTRSTGPRERLGLAPIRDGFFGGLWTNHVRLYRGRRSPTWCDAAASSRETSASTSMLLPVRAQPRLRARDAAGRAGILPTRTGSATRRTPAPSLPSTSAAGFSERSIAGTTRSRTKGKPRSS